jgi:arabinofuranan 3-O-arabinosyltransferase
MSGQDGAGEASQIRTSTRPQAARLVFVIGLTLSLGYLIVLGGTYLKGNFLADPQGRPIANDFVNVVAAGRLALAWEAASAYDWPIHKQAEIRAVGHDFENYFGWHYPPTFLFVATALATLPYLAAAVVWLVATFGLYAAAIVGILSRVVDRRTGFCVALGFPAALWNITAGQNGFLTAALIGSTLGLLERRPALAGICLGLLTYKPQFGLLFPFVLIADRRWLTMAVAAATAITMAILSWLAFGGASWLAFVHWMPITSHVVLDEGGADWSRLQSLFGLVVAHGGSERLAWSVQAAGSMTVGIGVVGLWRSRVPFDLKAAALAAATLVVTPYLYMYDIVVLAVAVAFLLRFALERGFIAGEASGLGAAAALILIYPYFKTQLGLAAVLIVLGLVARRAWAELTRPAPKPDSAPAMQDRLPSERMAAER